MATPTSNPPRTGDDLHRNLMVNNLPEAWTATELQELFQQYGSIEGCNVITNKQTGKSKGYGFVKFFQRAEAEAALAAVNGHTVDVKPLVVKKADLGKGPPGPATIYVSGFTPGALSEQSLQELYEPYGAIQRLKLHPPQPGKKGVAFVTFSCFAEAELAVNATNGQVVFTGDTVQVKFDHKTAQAAQAAQGKVVAGPTLAAPPGTLGMMVPPFMLTAPAQRALKGRGPPVRFEPYDAMGAKAKAMFGGNVAMPLPNGSDGNYCLFVYGVQSPQALQQLFMPFGTVAAIRIQPGKRFGFVSMPVYYEAVNAINNLNGQALPGGVTLQVRMAADGKKDAAAAAQLGM